MAKVQAPFTDDQVESLNAYQESGVFKPFSCGNKSSHPTLIAHNKCWVCAECTYTQQWSHSWMADWSWEQIFNFGQQCSEEQSEWSDNLYSLIEELIKQQAEQQFIQDLLDRGKAVWEEEYPEGTALPHGVTHVVWREDNGKLNARRKRFY